MFGRTSSADFDPAKDIPDLTGKVVIVTGGNSGIGYISCLRLVQKNAHVYMASRNAEKAEKAVKKLKETFPDAQVSILILDLASLESVNDAADTFLGKESRLDILMNNAGVAALPPAVTKEGYEIQFGTNHLGHFYFTNLLLPILKSTRASSTAASGRVVSVSSYGHKTVPAGGIAFDKLNTDMSATNTWVRYGQSKLANILFTKHLAVLNPDLICTVLHPGAIESGLGDTFGASHPYLNAIARPILFRLIDKPEFGALNQLWCATSADAKTGVYYVPVGKENTPTALAQDVALAERLWTWSAAELEKLGRTTPTKA